MKVNRTYSMDYDLVLQLARKVNQSQTVCKALRKYLTDEEEITPSDFTTRQLLAALQSRFEPDTFQYVTIQSLIMSL